jgi:hypothetical protein
MYGKSPPLPIMDKKASSLKRSMFGSILTQENYWFKYCEVNYNLEDIIIT